MGGLKKILFLSSLSLLMACSSLAQNSLSSKEPILESHLVLTSVAPIFNISQALTVNTTITVENIPTKPRSMAAQATLFSRQAERYAEQFMQADAVITMGKIWPEDSLYTTAREANIRIVNIDASKPWSHVLSGVAISTSPVSGDVSPYFWTSPTNTIRMLNIVASDLQTLYPDQADTIVDNLEKEKGDYLDLKANFEKQFINVLDPVVYALTDEFTYLTSELGIFVDDYFIKQDIDWTAEDLTNLTNTLMQSNIKVVIHKWEPSEEIQAAIAAADAKLLVLDLMETTTKSLQISMENNLQGLLSTLLSAAE